MLLSDLAVDLCLHSSKFAFIENFIATFLLGCLWVIGRGHWAFHRLVIRRITFPLLVSCLSFLEIVLDTRSPCIFGQLFSTSSGNRPFFSNYCIKITSEIFLSPIKETEMIFSFVEDFTLFSFQGQCTTLDLTPERD